MNDASTQQPIKVRMAGKFGPYLFVDSEQIPDVQRRLDRAGLRYTMSEDSISLGGGPFMRDVYFHPTIDPSAIQAALDDETGAGAGAAP